MRIAAPAPALAPALALACALVPLAPSAARAAGPPFLPTWPGRLQSEVARLTRGFDGEVMLYVKDLPTGVRYEHDAATPAYLASGVKLAFMVELFREEQAGLLSLDDEVPYDDDDVRDGAPLFNGIRPGSGAKIPLSVLLESMIQESDNAASDMIAKKLGIENINRGLASLGYGGFGPITTLIDVRRIAYSTIDRRVAELSPRELRTLGAARTIEGRVARLAELLGEPPGTWASADLDLAFDRYYAMGYNSASMESVGALLEGIATGKVVSSTACREMLEIMSGTQTGSRRVAAGLPMGTRLAHKTGTQYKRILDLAIIYVAADHPVVFASALKTGRSMARAEDVIAALARRTYALLSPDADPAAERIAEKRRVRRAPP